MSRLFLLFLFSCSCTFNSTIPSLTDQTKHITQTSKNMNMTSQTYNPSFNQGYNKPLPRVSPQQQHNQLQHQYQTQQQQYQQPGQYPGQYNHQMQYQQGSPGEQQRQQKQYQQYQQVQQQQQQDNRRTSGGSQQTAAVQSSLMAWFDAVDTDHSGTLSCEELQRALMNGKQASKEHITFANVLDCCLFVIWRNKPKDCAADKKKCLLLFLLSTLFGTLPKLGDWTPFNGKEHEYIRWWWRWSLTQARRRVGEEGIHAPRRSFISESIRMPSLCLEIQNIKKKNNFASHPICPPYAKIQTHGWSNPFQLPILTPLLFPLSSNSWNGPYDDEYVRPRQRRDNLLQRIHRPLELHREMEAMFPSLRPWRLRNHRHHGVTKGPSRIRLQPLGGHCPIDRDKVRCEGTRRYQFW